MSRADGYIEIPANVDIVEAGTSVEVTCFRWAGLKSPALLLDGVADVLDSHCRLAFCLAKTTLNDAPGFLSLAFGL